MTEKKENVIFTYKKQAKCEIMGSKLDEQALEEDYWIATVNKYKYVSGIGESPSHALAELIEVMKMIDAT